MLPTPGIPQAYPSELAHSETQKAKTTLRLSSSLRPNFLPTYGPGTPHFGAPNAHVHMFAPREMDEQDCRHTSQYKQQCHCSACAAVHTD